MDFNHLSYFAVLLFVGLESVGVPVPGETVLLTASVYAGTTHQFNIFFVILFSTIGAILGDNIGYVIGRKGGFFLLRKYGKHIKVDENKLKLGQYLFNKYGGRVVFWGRFFSLLRMFAAFLAGTNDMPWKRFLVFNALGGLVWSTLYGFIGYTFGKNIHQLDVPLKLVAIGLFIAVLLGIGLFIKRNVKRLEKEALKAMPGPIEKYRT